MDTKIALDQRNRCGDARSLVYGARSLEVVYQLIMRWPTLFLYCVIGSVAFMSIIDCFDNMAKKISAFLSLILLLLQLASSARQPILLL